jgi:hypothetical protein
MVVAAMMAGCGSSARLTGNVVLNRTSVPMGDNVGGRLIFHNPTTHTVVMLRADACGRPYEVLLRSPSWYQPGVFTFDCGKEEALVAKPGTTVYRFTILARSLVCSGSGPTGPNLCAKDVHGKRDIEPEAPPGQYSTVFTPSAAWKGPTIKEATLIVTRER